MNSNVGVHGGGYGTGSFNERNSPQRRALRGEHKSEAFPKALARALASDIFPKEEQTEVGPFLRPDPEVLSEAIPVFFIGRNRDGCWVARDAEGKFGGLFWRKEGALRFARRSAGPVGCATVFPRGHVELDIENSGNPFVPWVAAIRHLVTRAMSTIMASLRKAARP